MCYKENRHRQLNIKLSEKLENVPDFIADFFDGYKSAATKNCNWGYIRDLLEWLIKKGYIKKSDISKITTDDINRVTSSHIVKYLNELQAGTYKRKNSLESIRTKKHVFGAFWNYMFLDNYVDDNIIQHISSKLFKSEITQKEVYVPTDEQIDNFLAKLGEGKNNSSDFTIIRNLTIVRLIMGSGIRSEELINLDIKDIYLDECPSYIMVLGKGKIETYDQVYIFNDAKLALVEYLKCREKFIEKNDIKDDALFLSNDRKRISKTSIANFFNIYSNGEIYPHSLRHWVGIKLYNNTKDIVLVQRQLRHKNMKTAAEYYVHTDKNDIANAVADL